MECLDTHLQRLTELKEEAAITVGLIAETQAKVNLYLQNPELAETHFDEEKTRADLNRYRERLLDIQCEADEINGQIQNMAGVHSEEATG